MRRAAFALLVPLGLAGGTGCQEPTACTLVLLIPSVSVDVAQLGVDPATTDARICLDDDCSAADLRTALPEPPHGAGPVTAVWERDIPDRERVDVTLVLSDRAGVGERYRGQGRVWTETVEPNGPGCGETVPLPPLTALPDGSLRAG